MNVGKDVGSGVFNGGKRNEMRWNGGKRRGGGLKRRKKKRSRRCPFAPSFPTRLHSRKKSHFQRGSKRQHSLFPLLFKSKEGKKYISALGSVRTAENVALFCWRWWVSVCLGCEGDGGARATRTQFRLSPFPLHPCKKNRNFLHCWGGKRRCDVKSSLALCGRENERRRNCKCHLNKVSFCVLVRRGKGKKTGNKFGARKC